MFSSLAYPKFPPCSPAHGKSLLIWRNEGHCSLGKEAKSITHSPSFMGLKVYLLGYQDSVLGFLPVSHSLLIIVNSHGEWAVKMQPWHGWNSGWEEPYSPQQENTFFFQFTGHDEAMRQTLNSSFRLDLAGKR